MFHQIIGEKNIINYWIFVLELWIGLKQEALGVSNNFCILPSFVILLNLNISNKEFDYHQTWKCVTILKAITRPIIIIGQPHFSFHSAFENSTIQCQVCRTKESPFHTPSWCIQIVFFSCLLSLEMLWCTFWVCPHYTPKTWALHLYW